MRSRVIFAGLIVLIISAMGVFAKSKAPAPNRTPQLVRNTTKLFYNANHFVHLLVILRLRPKLRFFYLNTLCMKQQSS